MVWHVLFLAGLVWGDSCWYSICNVLPEQIKAEVSTLYFTAILWYLMKLSRLSLTAIVILEFVDRYNYLNDLPSLDPELYRHLIFLKVIFLFRLLPPEINCTGCLCFYWLHARRSLHYLQYFYLRLLSRGGCWAWVLNGIHSNFILKVFLMILNLYFHNWI